MSESTQNEGKTVLQLDEKTMDQLRSVGYLLVAFDGGNAKLGNYIQCSTNAYL